MNRIDHSLNSEAVTIDRLLTSFCSEGSAGVSPALPSPAG
jgi:hypothetical protein